MSRPALISLALCAAAEPAIALCTALAIPAGQGDAAPDWIHLLPAGEITTTDGRGPYRVADPAALIAASLHGDARLPLDENHSTDLAAPQGNPAPARGWIVAMQSRDDGIWGQVEWTAAGRRLVVQRSYRSISPVIQHRADGTVVGVLRASLVNRPNLRGLAALHQQDDRMDFMTRLREALGLGKDADEASILERAKSSTSAIATHAAQLAPIAKAAGLPEGAAGPAIVTAIQALSDPAKTVPAATVVALQTEISDLKKGIAKKAAETAVDAAIKAGKIAQPDVMREHYVARHMADAAAVDRELGAMISLHGRSGATGGAPTLGADGKPQLDGDEAKIVSLLGVDPKSYAATKAKVAEREEML